MSDADDFIGVPLFRNGVTARRELAEREAYLQPGGLNKAFATVIARKPR